MYESYYGFTEKPFSLTPDPKYFYRSQSHGDAFDLLQYAIRRREGLVVVTGEIGTGKTTLCRALLEQVDRTTFTALVLNPFLSETDLLKRILQDFGVISRDDAKAGRLAAVSTHELIDALHDFLLGLIPLKARAVLVIDEAHNLPRSVLEQIRILSNLETDKEKLLQIILVGQLELQTLLRSPDLRQLDQRVSIRYVLAPLDREASGAYVSHRLAIAGGESTVAFMPGALDRVHRLSGGIPRLINLICDRALLSGYSLRTNRVSAEMVDQAAESLDVQTVPSWRPRWADPRTSFAAAAMVVLVTAIAAAAFSAYMYQRFTARVEARSIAPPRAAATPARRPVLSSRALPANAAYTILLASYPAGTLALGPSDEMRTLTKWLEGAGTPVYYAEIDRGQGGRWRRLMAGAYSDEQDAQRELERLRSAAPALEGRVVAAAANGTE